MQTTRGTALTPTAPPTGQARRGIDRRLVWLLITVTGLAVDQVTKQLAVTRLDPTRPVEVLGPLLRLQLTWNDGAAFSLGGGARITWVFTTFAAIVLVGVVGYAFARLRHRGWAVVLGLLGAGITGNLTDRLLRPPGFGVGHVVDFLQLPYWPIFNVADICVTSAAVGIVWLAVIKNVSPGYASGRPPEPEQDTEQEQGAAREQDTDAGPEGDR